MTVYDFYPTIENFQNTALAKEVIAVSTINNLYEWFHDYYRKFYLLKYNEYKAELEEKVQLYKHQNHQKKVIELGLKYMDMLTKYQDEHDKVANLELKVQNQAILIKQFEERFKTLNEKIDLKEEILLANSKALSDKN